MLKKLNNRYEKLTNIHVNKICKRYNAVAYPKIRIADVLEIEGSGISEKLYTYALKAHFDTIVYGEDEYPLFVVEFDGKRHIHDDKQIERDFKKNELCRRFGLPLLRINTHYVDNEYGDLNLLSWIIEVWFASKWFYQEQEHGEFAIDEPFSTWSFTRIDGSNKMFPLWLSKSAREKIGSLYLQGLIQNFAPNSVVYIDQDYNYHSIAWVVIDDLKIVFTKKTMSGQSIPVPIHELLEDITIVDLSKKLLDILNGNVGYQTFEELNQEIKKHKSQYSICCGGQEPHSKIEELN